MNAHGIAHKFGDKILSRSLGGIQNYAAGSLVVCVISCTGGNKFNQTGGLRTNPLYLTQGIIWCIQYAGKAAKAFEQPMRNFIRIASFMTEKEQQFQYIDRLKPRQPLCEKTIAEPFTVPVMHSQIDTPCKLSYTYIQSCKTLILGFTPHSSQKRTPVILYTKNASVKRETDSFHLGINQLPQRKTHTCPPA